MPCPLSYKPTSNCGHVVGSKRLKAVAQGCEQFFRLNEVIIYVAKFTEIMFIEPQVVMTK